MNAVRDRVQATADSLTDAIDDALHDFDWDRAQSRLQDAIELYDELRTRLDEAPYLSVDLSECEREIRLLTEAFEKKNRLIPMLELDEQTYNESSNRFHERHSHLLKAANYNKNARNALSEGCFDLAWSETEKARNEYILHANYQRWPLDETMQLVASCSKLSANILRLEGRHIEALRHYLYYLMHQKRLTKTDTKRLSAYIKDSQLSGGSVGAAMDFIDKAQPQHGFPEVDNLINSWRSA